MKNIIDRFEEKYEDAIYGLLDRKEAKLERSQGILVGHHMNVKVKEYPYYNGPILLSDATAIIPGDRIGQIHLLRNLPKLNREDDLLKITRKLYQRVLESMEELAALSENNDPRLDGVNAFYGTSHLAGPLATRLGFDVRKIDDSLERNIETFFGRTLVFCRSSHKNWGDKWKQVKNKEAQNAFISRRKLVQMYGQK